MLRRITHIIMALFLTTATAGVTISMHYCGGELISTSLYVEAEACCDSDDCCKNKTEVYQLDEDFSVSTAIEIPESVHFYLLAVSLVVFNSMIEENSIAEDYELIDSPPPPKIQTSLAIRQTYLL
ncbi:MULTISPECIES: HYC_CC_PP family protein [unclassified Saccharicrinis]|uniref:HYC_CC_PP family protein n=1 Tax=unclassified Saccharicrinis TaxID=2646859 RepID=UPI003D33338D